MKYLLLMLLGSCAIDRGEINYTAIMISCNYDERSPWAKSMKKELCNPDEMRKFVKDVMLKHPKLFDDSIKNLLKGK